MLQTENQKRDFIAKISKDCNVLFDDEKGVIVYSCRRSLLATLADQLQFIEPQIGFLNAYLCYKNQPQNQFSTNRLTDIIKAEDYLLIEIDMVRTKLAEEIIQKILKGKYQFDKMVRKYTLTIRINLLS